MVFRVLLVEDEPDTRTQITELIEERIPGCLVNAVGSVADGQKLIEQARVTNVPFLAAVLDIKVPKTFGEEPQTDATLCVEFQASFREGLVFHITGFKGDPDVDEHIRQEHPPDKPRGFVFDKGEDFPDNLVNQLRKYLFNTQIRNVVSGLFIPIQYSGAGSPSGSSGIITENRSTTSQLADLHLNVRQCWPYLDQSTKDFVATYLDVTDLVNAPLTSLH